MSTEEKPSEFQEGIVTAIKKTGAEESTQLEVLGSLKEFTDKIGEWESKASNINVTSVEQKDDMKLARESRLGIRSIRLEMTARLKDLKSDALKRCQGIDAVTRFIKDKLDPLEKKLKHHEEFEKRYEEEERVKRIQLRAGQLAALGAQTKHLDLGNMGEDDWKVVLQEARDAKAAREKREADEKAERERKEREEAEERERIRKENEALKKKAEEQEAAHKAVVERQKKMQAVQGLTEYEVLAEMSEEEFTAELKVATESHKAKQEAEAKAEEERQRLHRKILSRQEAIQNYGGSLSYDALKELSDEEYKSKLADYKRQSEERQKQEAERKKKEEAERIAREKAEREAAELRKQKEQEAKDRAEKEKAEAEERKRIEASKVSSAANNAADILLETAETWAKRNPDIEGGKALFVAAAIERLKN